MRYLIAGYEDRCKNYMRALSAAGHTYEVSLDVTRIDEHMQAHLGEPEFDRLLLPGGGDIAPARYGQKLCGSDAPDPVLDGAQFQILEMFVRHKKPVLGICRGHQLINVFFGGDLIQDLPLSQRVLHTSAEADMLHEVSAAPGSCLERVCGGKFMVNSRHHQAIGRLGCGLKAVAWSQDGVIEAIRHESLPVLGLQWHPERMPLQHILHYYRVNA